MRRVSITRTTKETDISVRLNLDGTGAGRRDTGIGFLDHMLDAFARHALLDLEITAKGDLHIDNHHTTEDTGIVIGQAVRRALGDLRGVRRFADAAIPMDETLTRAAIDLSGRPYLVWRVDFPRATVGTMDTELFREWFQAFATNAFVTLHVETLYGENCHHIAESCFKATARALRAAVEPDPRIGMEIPSTKGSLSGDKDAGS